MKGLKLFVRPGDVTDLRETEDFLRTHAPSPGSLSPSSAAEATRDSSAFSIQQPPTPFLIGKLLGELVAILTFDLEDGDALRVHCIVVADGLRRKRIGRAMFLELESVAAKLERPTIVIRRAGDAEGFLTRVGFAREGEIWVKRVASQSQS